MKMFLRNESLVIKMKKKTWPIIAMIVGGFFAVQSEIFVIPGVNLTIAGLILAGIGFMFF